ncbi:MAG: hypothetical protein NO475_05830 [Candidatus Methanomethylicia archaeon]|nr:hypothetical protein [Candidatus Methanomethylicia archaeon]NHV45777.1 hypothetical protein [Candidatus Verstraetearchaeota archaeon]
MKFKLFDISIETPRDWRIRITESSNYESGRMAVISPKKLYIAIRWQNTDIKKTSLKDYIEEVLTQRKDKRIKDLKILENTGFEKEGHEYRFIRVSFIYKKLLNPPKPQEYIGYLILCKRTNRLIGAFTNYPIEAIDESIEYLEKPLKSIICECNK